MHLFFEVASMIYTGIELVNFTLCILKIDT